MWLGGLVWLAACDALHDVAPQLEQAADATPGAEVPCGGGYETNTQLALAKQLVVVDRFYEDGRRQTLRVPLGEVDHVQIERVPRATGGLCSVVWLHKTDGTRLIFDDDADADLTGRARHLAVSMGRPLQEPPPARDEG